MSEPDPAPERPAPRPGRFRILLWLEAAVVLALIGYSISPGPDEPAVDWRDPTVDRALSPMAEVAADTALVLDLDLPDSAHIYVVSHDLMRGNIALFPSAFLRADRTENPLPPGRHRLPGNYDGRRLRWTAGDGVGAVTIVALICDVRQPDLEQTLATCRQGGNAAFPAQEALGIYAPAAGMNATPPRERFAHPLLEAAARLPSAEHDGAALRVPGYPGVRASVLRIMTPIAGPMDLAELQAQIQERLGTPLPPVPPPEQPDGAPPGTPR